MTSPLAGGGRPVVLTPGNAVMLTEYAAGPDAPLTIINTSTTDLVYVADSSSVAASNGVPVNGGTSIPWTQPGQVWAVLDPAATDTATVTITGAISDWSPSPAALAAAVAAELLGQGIPNVLLQDTLYNAAMLNTAPGVWSLTKDVSKYASITLSSINTSGTDIGSGISYQFLDSTGDVIFNDFLSSRSLAISPVIILPVYGPTLQVANNTGVSERVIVLGSNRPVTAPSVPTQSDFTVSSLTQAWTNGTKGPLTTTQYSGLVTVGLASGSTTTGPKGVLLIEDQQLNEMVIADDSEWHIQGGNIARIYKNVVHPRSPVRWYWLPTASATYNITLNVAGA